MNKAVPASKAVPAPSPRVRRRDIPLIRCVLRYALAAALLLVCCRARAGIVTSFGSGVFIALMLHAKYAGALLPAYLLAVFVSGSGVNGAAAALTEGAVLSAASLVCTRVKASRLPAVKAVSAVAARSAHIVAAAIMGGEMFTECINSLFALITAYAAACALKPFFEQKFRVPSDSEYACMGIVAVFAFSGLASLSGVWFSPAIAAGAAAVTLGGALFGRAGVMIAAVCAGVGTGLADYSAVPIAFFAVLALCMVMFVRAPKLIAAASLLLAAVIFELYFAVPYERLPVHLWSIFAGELLFIFVPKSKLDAIVRRFLSPPRHVALRALLSAVRRSCAGEIAKTAEVYAEMGRSLAAGIKTSAVTADEVCARLSSSVCAGCDRCRERGIEDGRERALAALGEITVSDRPPAAMDVPFFIENDCPHTARLLSLTGEINYGIRLRRAEEGRDNALREQLGAGMTGAAEAMNGLSARVEKSPESDLAAEDKLRDELSAAGAGAADVVAFADGTAAVVVRNGSDERAVAEACGRVLGGSVSIVPLPSAGPDFTVLSVRRKTRYDAVFAVSNVSCSAAGTGDAHSFMRIGETGFMLALSDGMGHGRGAGKVSDAALSLAEAYFRAGFDATFALSAVNDMMSREEGEAFAAFDLMVCDLDTLDRTVIKLGSPASYVRSDRAVLKIEGSSLPLGALRSGFKPSVVRDKAEEGDAVVFVSDGVSDAFEGDSLPSFIASLDFRNVKAACESITSRARELRGGEVRDDMTVVAARVFRRME